MSTPASTIATMASIEPADVGEPDGQVADQGGTTLLAALLEHRTDPRAHWALSSSSSSPK